MYRYSFPSVLSWSEQVSYLTLIGEGGFERQPLVAVDEYFAFFTALFLAVPQPLAHTGRWEPACLLTVHIVEGEVDGAGEVPGGCGAPCDVVDGEITIDEFAGSDNGALGEYAHALTLVLILQLQFIPMLISLLFMLSSRTCSETVYNRFLLKLFMMVLNE